MSSRILRMLAACAAAAIIATAVGNAAAGGPAGNLEGKYRTIKPPQPTANPERVEVIEFFAYDCRPCYRIVNDMRAFEAGKPEYVDLHKIPFFPNSPSRVSSWRKHAKAYYAATILGVLERTHGAFYEAFHVHKRKLRSDKAIIDWFEEQGINRSAFENAYRSERVKDLMKAAKATWRRYRIRGVPLIAINGEYRVMNKGAKGYVDDTLYGNIVPVTRALAQRAHEEKTE